MSGCAVKIYRVFCFLLFAFTFFLFTFSSGCKDERQKESQTKSAPDAVTQNGETVLTISKSAQEKAGVIVTTLKTVSHQQEIQAYGTVIQPVALVSLRNSYLSLKSAMEKADASLDASRKEYERLKKLNEDNHNISDKALQASSAVLTSNEADASAAREKLQAVRQTAVVQWGKVIAGWLLHDSPEFKRLMELKEVLIRITPPSDRFIKNAPGAVSIQTQEQGLIRARFISPSPDADPRTQGPGYFYAAPFHAPVLVPGMNVSALMPFGPQLKGISIPFSSVIWFQGKSWAYVQTGPEHFTRREVPTTDHLQEGYFVQHVFQPGEKIVLKGAQALLSQELLPSKPAPGREEEED